jgi:CubicO group peptidase (beta-lactamase class C family)
MNHLTRRAMLAGSVAAVASAARAQSPYAAAAAYSAQHAGVSTLVMVDGRIAFEDYPNGGAPEQPRPLASGTKSFTGLMAAAAVQDRLLTLNEPAAGALTEWRDDPAKRGITVRHLLTLTSGLQTNRTRGDVLPAAEALQLPVVAEPGARFAYGGDPFQIFAELMRRKLKGEDPAVWLERRLLTPAGVRAGRWGRVSDGLPQIAGGARLTARDWARFGEFVRLQGRVNGRQLVDAQALTACFQGTKANPAYGLGWWLNRRVSDEQRRTIPQLRRAMDLSPDETAIPADLVMAAGAGKQRLYVSREARMVVVRQAGRIREAMADAEPGGFSDAAFWRLLRPQA